MSTAILNTHELSKSFGSETVLNHVSLSLDGGEILGVLGPNGAGKTTLISLICGQRRPSAGEVRVCGADPRIPSTRALLGLTPQATGVPENLSVAEVLRFARAHYAQPDSVQGIAERCALGDLLKRRCGALSGGQQRRVALALAMIGRPQLLVLDEPTTGLDLDSRHQLWSLIQEFRDGGGAVMMSSHYLEEIQQLADRVLVLDNGEVLIDDATDAVMNRVSLVRVSFSTDQRDLSGVAGAGELHREGDQVTILSPDPDALVHRLISEEIAFASLRIRGASLEEAFTAATAKTTAKTAGGNR